jgi:hypothetical protein
MNQDMRRRWQTGAAVISALIVGALLPIAPVAADAQQEDPQPAPTPTDGTGPAVYILDGGVVAIRRDPLPPGAYGGQGVDYSPDMTAYILGDPCGN